MTSYDKEEIKDRPLNLINKLIEKLNMDKDVVAEFKGLHFFLYENHEIYKCKVLSIDSCFQNYFK